LNNVLRYTIPNSFTAASLLLGIASIVTTQLGGREYLELAGWMIVWCGLLDTMDGVAARILKATSSFGAEFDSMADLIAFGVAPAILVLNAGVQIGLCTDLGLECSYSQDYRNVGTGCANNLRGKIRAFQGDALLQTVDWSLATSVVIQPGEIFPVEDCCFASSTVEAANRYTGEAFWNNVPCS